MNCVTLEMSLNLSGLQFPSCKVRYYLTLTYCVILTAHEVEVDWSQMPQTIASVRIRWHIKRHAGDIDSFLEFDSPGSTIRLGTYDSSMDIEKSLQARSKNEYAIRKQSVCLSEIRPEILGSHRDAAARGRTPYGRAFHVPSGSVF